jgi:predicted O-methyltransferase YrrM
MLAIHDMIEKFTRVDERIYAYVLAHQSPEHSVLTELRSLTEGLAEAKMQSTVEQGHFLALLVKLIAARRVLEIGTFTGTSALAMALALPNGGSVTTCDVSQDWCDIGRPFWRRAEVADRIDFRLGPAHATLASIEQSSGPNQFDLAFIDADKTGYDAYYEACLRLVRPGRLVVLDNTLRRGRVVDLHDIEDDTEAHRIMNRKIAADERVDRVLLPIASGMTLARRR